MDGELEQLGERIAEQAVHLDAAMHRLLADLREFDRRGGWRPQGARTCAHWLAWRVGWDLVTARARVRVAHRLGELPEIDEALRRGEVSYAKVRAMVRVATVDNQELLLGYAQQMTGAQLERLSRKLALVARHEAAPDPRVDAERRYVRRRDTDDGMVKLEAVLHPEEAAVVWAMLDHAAAQRVAVGAANDSAESPGVDPDVAADAEVVGRVVESAVDVARIRSVGDSAESPASQSELRRREVAQRSAFDRADALVSIAQGYVRGDRPERSPIEVTITIEERGLREAAAAAEVGAEVADLGDGFVSSAAARRLACDASVIELREAPDGTALALGRKRRTVSGALKRALIHRDATCCFPGCTHRNFLEGHHLRHWADGGETNLANLALVCDFHHRFVHEYGYTVELGSDRRPRFRDPKGQTVGAQPARPSPAGLGWEAIRAAHAALALHADTAGAGGDGTHVDYPALVGHLLVAGAVTTRA